MLPLKPLRLGAPWKNRGRGAAVPDLTGSWGQCPLVVQLPAFQLQCTELQSHRVSSPVATQAADRVSSQGGGPEDGAGEARPSSNDLSQWLLPKHWTYSVPQTFWIFDCFWTVFGRSLKSLQEPTRVPMARASQSMCTEFSWPKTNNFLKHIQTHLSFYDILRVFTTRQVYQVLTPRYCRWV